MQTVDEKPETIHLYVVRETAPKLSPLPIVLSALTLLLVMAVSVVFPYQQPVTRVSIRIPAVLLPLRTFTARVAIIPTGIRVYSATTAHGILTITNGSIIGQSIPAGFTVQGVVTDYAVYVPGGNANGYGYATVSAHALTYGKKGNLLTYAIDYVEGANIYIRNLTPFTGGRDSYSVKYATAQDKQTALIKARSQLEVIAAGLRYPCKEIVFPDTRKKIITWRCQFVSYQLPAFMHVSSVRIIGNNLLLQVWFVPRPIRVWVK
jgi:hypothetical protein